MVPGKNVMDPLVFTPYARPMVWGGRRLGELFGKALPGPETFGESWEMSGHPHHVSRVAEGPLAGTSLADLAAERPAEVYGATAAPVPEFPLLVKLLDCRDLLSVQVHPDDARARSLSKERFGKTEAWLVLDVSPGGKVYAGLKPGVNRDDLVRALAEGAVESCLHAFRPEPGDCIFLPAGTVHAVGGGVVIAEVQQSSDATFRLFDWNRPGPDGRPRALHVDESLASIDWSAGPVRPVKGEPLGGLPEGVEGERLVACPYFVLERYRACAPFDAPGAGRMAVWMVTDGDAELTARGGDYRRTFRRGETVLVPAAADRPAWRPLEPGRPVTLLAATLPPA